MLGGSDPGNLESGALAVEVVQETPLQAVIDRRLDGDGISAAKVGLDLPVARLGEGGEVPLPNRAPATLCPDQFALMGNLALGRNERTGV